LGADGIYLAPFVEEGQTSSKAMWSQLMQTFQGNFIGFAIFIN
jgi:hypothetical protein